MAQKGIRYTYNLLTGVRVIIFTRHESVEYIRKSLARGVLEYILKCFSLTELLDAIHAVYNGEIVISSTITQLVIENYHRWCKILGKNSINGLSPPESEIIQPIAEGYSSEQITDILCISIKTVQVHRSNLMAKLELHNRGKLSKYASIAKTIDL